MEKTIDSSTENAYGEKAGLYGASQYFSPRPLGVYDKKTTISANVNSRNAYEESQSLISAFGKALDTDANNILSIHIAFQEYDDMISALIESGYRNPVIILGRAD